MRSNRGFSILEVLIGSTILVLVAFAFFQFQSMTSKQVRAVEDKAALARALVSIERDIMKDMAFLPPQENDDPVPDSAIFRDGAKAGTRCYDKSGALATSCDAYETTPPLYFRTQFYKVRVVDQSVNSASPLARIPVSRVRFRVEYKVSDKLQPPMFFSRLYTDALRY